MTQLIVRTFDEDEEEMTTEQIEQAMRVAWEALQSVPSYVERPQPEEENN